MNKDFFWNTIEGPIVGLSPMDGVTDAPMRFIAKKYGQPDIIYTEFVSAEGLWRIKKRGEMDHRIWNELNYGEIERPVIAQIFGSDPEAFYEAAKIICDLGFDGIDINMGCPSPGLEKRGGGAGLIRDKCNAVEVVEATRKGVNDWLKTQKTENSKNQNVEIPVSVKTRIGSDKPDEEWWITLAGMKLPAVAMHGRTFKQLYSGEADWEILFKAGEIIREGGAKFLGNGDISRLQVSDDRSQFGVVTKTGLEIELTGKMDGVLIGREAMGNPWALRKVTQCHSDTITLEEKLGVMVEHAKKYEEVFNEINVGGVRLPRHEYIPRNDSRAFQFFPMRKHLACYARGFEGSSGLRKKLMTAENAEQVEMMMEEFLSEGL